MGHSRAIQHSIAPAHLGFSFKLVYGVLMCEKVESENFRPVEVTVFQLLPRAILESIKTSLFLGRYLFLSSICAEGIKTIDHSNRHNTSIFWCQCFFICEILIKL